MRTASPLTLGLAAVLFVPGCRPKNLPPSQQPGQTEPLPAAKPRAAHGDRKAAPATIIYGFVRVANPARLLSEIRTRFMPGAGSALSNADLMRLVLQGVGGNEAMAEHLDLSQPAGCLVASPKRHSRPAVCVVGYHGGIGQLVEDVGPEHLRSGGADYAALEVDGTNVFAAVVGSQLALSLDAELIAATRPMLESQLIDPPPGATRDVVATTFPNVIWADAEEEIEGFFQMMDAATSVPATGNPGLDAYRSGALSTSLSAYRSVAELSEMRIWFDIGANGTEVGYQGVALPDTTTARNYAKAKAIGPLDPSLLEALPRNPVFSLALTMDVKGMGEDPMFAAYLKLCRDVDAATHNTNFAALLEESFKVWGELLVGPGAIALVAPARGKWAIDHVYAVHPGVEARPALRKLFGTITPTQLGPDFARYVKWRIRANAFTVGGTKVDVLTLKPTAAGLAKMRSLPGLDPMLKMFGASPTFSVAFTQLDRRLLVVTTPGSASNHMKALLNGVASPAAPAPEVQASVRANADASALGFMDVDAAFDWVRSFTPNANVFKLRTGPGDVVFSSRMSDVNTREHRLSVAHSIVEQLLKF